MTYLRCVSLVLALAGTVLLGATAQAAPVHGARDLTRTTSQLANPKAVTPVRGCHRGWQRHYVGRWNRVRWHRRTWGRAAGQSAWPRCMWTTTITRTGTTNASASAARGFAPNTADGRSSQHLAILRWPHYAAA